MSRRPDRLGAVPGPLPAGRTRAQLLDEVARVLQAVAPAEAVVIALSGGPDSTALAHLVSEARPDLDSCLAHVRHGLRDDQNDLEVVATHAKWLDLPLEVHEVEVRADGRGLEAAAREARYAALRQVAGLRAASAILVGHTADDQAETMLLRLARGTGIDGLSAMRCVQGDLVRPMLRLRREDVHRFVSLEGLPVAQDPTNQDPAIRRSIVRYEVLPALTRVAPDPVGSLGRLADLVSDEVMALERLATSGMNLVRRVGPVRAIPTSFLKKGHPGTSDAAVARRVIRSVLEELGGEPPDAATVSRVLGLPDGSAASLPGPIEVTSAGGWRAFAPRRLPQSDPVELPETGLTPWPAAGLRIERLATDARSTDVGISAVDHEPGLVALPGMPVVEPPIDDALIDTPGVTAEWLRLALPRDVGTITVRHRQPGDRVATAAGSRTLQDVLVDAGVPRALRDIWPVFVADDGRVIWCPGYCADDEVLRAGRRGAASRLRVLI